MRAHLRLSITAIVLSRRLIVSTSLSIATRLRLTVSLLLVRLVMRLVLLGLTVLPRRSVSGRSRLVFLEKLFKEAHCGSIDVWSACEVKVSLVRRSIGIKVRTFSLYSLSDRTPSLRSFGISSLLRKRFFHISHLKREFCCWIDRCRDL